MNAFTWTSLHKIGWASLIYLSLVWSTAYAEYTDPSSYTIYEAEDAALIGTVVSQEIPDYSGSGYVTGFEAAGDSVQFIVTVDQEGFYPMAIRYAAPSGDKTNYIEVNGSTAGEKLFPQAETFTDIDFGQIYLDEGDNVVGITSYWGYFDVDYIRVGPLQERPVIAPVQDKLVTPHPSAEAQNLMTYLTSQYGKSILAGQQQSTLDEASFIYKQTGKLPAIVSITATDLGDSALEWAKYGGLISSEWHWYAPLNEKDFMTSQTSFDVSKAVQSGTAENNALLKDLDQMAQTLKRFKDAKIPIIWRPLHEAEGGWFWWGSKGPEIAKELYAIMFERFTKFHGLNNLIWVWTTSDTIYSKEWCPGNNYVDIIGIDRYVKAGDYSTLMSVYDTAAAMLEGKKLVAYSENGPIPDPRQLKRNKVGWMYFNTWYGKVLTDGKMNSDYHLRMVYNHPYVITLDKLPSEKIYGKRPIPYPIPPASSTASPAYK
ncbi:Carbohydrate binding module (family 35) [Paenibacillus sp. 1_12]|uniref:glycosyl hydrolase n=1 Tax=Paenibacillus sp. 1_12 TaxID=1566278 RepID=UPI0008F0D96E|nr:glycosyl hydrolase [Paenibacillus sp. 1_12]SFM01715.1 Carbohydrate binding module (family 35) [Paenibacillus sp. 1_12]